MVSFDAAPAIGEEHNHDQAPVTPQAQQRECGSRVSANQMRADSVASRRLNAARVRNRNFKRHLTAQERAGKVPGRARRGPKSASLGGFRAQSWRLGVWASAGSRLPGWKVLGRFRLAGLDMVSGLSLMLAMACRHCAQRHPGCRVAAARGDRYPTAQAAQAAARDARRKSSEDSGPSIPRVCA